MSKEWVDDKPSAAPKDLRDEYMIAALPAVIMRCSGDNLLLGETAEQMFARKAGAIADAMMEARKK